MKKVSIIDRREKIELVEGRKSSGKVIFTIPGSRSAYTSMVEYAEYHGHKIVNGYDLCGERLVEVGF